MNCDVTYREIVTLITLFFPADIAISGTRTLTTEEVRCVVMTVQPEHRSYTSSKQCFKILIFSTKFKTVVSQKSHMIDLMSNTLLLVLFKALPWPTPVPDVGAALALLLSGRIRVHHWKSAQRLCEGARSSCDSARQSLAQWLIAT